MASKSTQLPETSERPQTAAKRRNAWQARDYETMFVTLVFLLSLLATLWMVLVSVTGPDPDTRLRIVPASAVMVMVEAWLIFSLPVYSKLAFWGSLISLATFLFFAVPFIFLGLLPDSLDFAAIFFSLIALVCGLLLFRQRERFLPPPTPVQRSRQNRPKSRD
ncbi:MAG TPA: hypothetical protein VH186_38570 [Chloroflexia bacterium]|nr:hypothetical protein [Chloroflexia bacterium]